MRDSNYTFPAQNRVCVSITAQLYDRRALDTSSSLPLLNSLTHLTYLTSTSPRIREILTIDGGLERLLEIIQQSSYPRPPPPPPDWYGLRGTSTASILSHTAQNSLRHSLAFQCVVNIGVRGSESVRTRVVQSGTLDVIAQIMEVWLVGRGMSIVSGPLGSQAAVDRAAREGVTPGSRSKDKEKHREHRPRTEEEQRRREREKRQRQESRVALAPVATGLPVGSRWPGQEQQRENIELAVDPAAPSPANPDVLSLAEQRALTMPRLEASLIQSDVPPLEQARYLTEDELRTVTRINGIARLTGSTSEIFRESIAGETALGERLRDYLTAFGLDVNVLIALHSRLRGARDSERAMRARAAARAAAAAAPVERQQDEDESMGVEMEFAIGSDGEGPRPSRIERRDTVVPRRNDEHSHTSDTGAPTPRAPSAPLPLATFAAGFAMDPSAGQNRSRSARDASTDSLAAFGAEQEEPGESMLAQSAGSSTSGLSLMNAAPASPRRGGPSSASRPTSGYLSYTPAVESNAISNSSTPLGTPPIQEPTTQRDRSGTITATGFNVPVAADAQRATRRRTTTAGTDGDQELNSRGGTEDESESADGGGEEQMEEQIGIVGATDDGDVDALDGLEGRGLGAGLGGGLGGVDAETQAQAEVDLAMGAPPGAPGAAQTPRIAEQTPRQANRAPLPAAINGVAGVAIPEGREPGPAPAVAIAAGAPRGFSDLSDLVHVIESTTESGESTYNDNTILLCLQLLAYLSKYPHVRAAFHHPRRPMHQEVAIPDDVILPERPSLFRSSNMFSLVERLTFRPSPPDPDLTRLPTDIQYWAGVIMRNACRKDDLHGGIRQCANMSCARWETFPREFAKCRRCRKAKYCSKDCQSKAWQEGHRFWCNARDPEPENPAPASIPGPARQFNPNQAAPSFPTVIANPAPQRTTELLRQRHRRIREGLLDQQFEGGEDVEMRSRTDVTPGVPDERQGSVAAEAMDVDQEDPRQNGEGTQNGVSPTATVPAAPIVPHAQPRPTDRARDGLRRWRA